jgi:hypothetical protein
LQSNDNVSTRASDVKESRPVVGSSKKMTGAVM